MRRIALIAAVVAAMPLASTAQTCNLPSAVHFDYLGAFTGCTRGGAKPCAVTEPISFTATGAPGTIPSCAIYVWDFGDGTATSPLPNPTHTYATAQQFVVFLRVLGSSQQEKDDGDQVPVVNTVLPRVLTFKATPSVLRAGQTVVFSWTTQNATKGVRIESTPAALKTTVATGNQFSYVPARSMSYTLTAIGDAAEMPSAAITVEVVTRRRAARH